jgi:Tfp pilus assembly protein PilX
METLKRLDLEHLRRMSEEQAEIAAYQHAAASARKSEESYLNQAPRRRPESGVGSKRNNSCQWGHSDARLMP